MIQRIQSIFLLLSVIALSLLFVDAFNFATVTGAPETDVILGDGDLDTYDYPMLIGLSGLGAVVLLISIFLFNNRNLQSNIVKLGLALVAALGGGAAYYFMTMNDTAESLNATLAPSFGWASPVLTLIFCGLALRAISKDDKLVKSMDRLR
jgi:hypothetical protein